MRGSLPAHRNPGRAGEQKVRGCQPPWPRGWAPLGKTQPEPPVPKVLRSWEFHCISHYCKTGMFPRWFMFSDKDTRLLQRQTGLMMGDGDPTAAKGPLNTKWDMLSYPNTSHVSA